MKRALSSALFLFEKPFFAARRPSEMSQDLYFVFRERNRQNLKDPKPEKHEKSPFSQKLTYKGTGFMIISSMMEVLSSE